ncbi:hypothetical protein ACP70R_032099 [Stipagrostis hirtigluma subsp. patula]
MYAAAAERADEGFSAMTEAEREAEAERRSQEVLEVAREIEREAREEAAPEAARQMARQARWHRGVARILDFDPKQRGAYHSRLYFVDHATFDLDEESPLGPMRYTDRVSKPGEPPYRPCAALNILSVKIGSSDVGFPIHVYGTVIARDSLDKKCLYLFRRDRDHCQLINSEDESLILTGPKRGLALITDNYVEIDLKVKDGRRLDRQLSKGIIRINGVARRLLDKCEVEIKSLATRLSTVEVMYAVLKRAVEGTIAIEVLKGDFYGEITAHTTSIKNSLVLYSSKVADAMSGDGNRVIQLMRPVVSVYLKDMLIIVVRTGDGKYERAIEFTPRVNNGDEDQFTVGVIRMRVKVTWSIMDF